ncbi:hypothetical protein EC844_12716 [Acinetobacter calcoaceticus]|uniref:Uncharacterized protein n=1 Tax=Acinetobacter calcoaceticus TaxID=471 RepID=A0A4V2QZR2_ACICA|nr:hypothetical protein EC844_12716 [Acinetobacter calcoaceticus]
MNLNYAHKPNYFLFAQLLIRHVEQYIKKHPTATQASFDLHEIYQVFRHDLASTTTNLEGILNICDAYKVDTLNGDQNLIQHYTIDAQLNTLQIDFHPDAAQSIREGKALIEPDATSYL